MVVKLFFNRVSRKKHGFGGRAECGGHECIYLAYRHVVGSLASVEAQQVVEVHGS